MRELDKVDADYPLTGPNHTELRQRIGVGHTALWNCLADGEAWKEWLGIDVEFTTPEPHGPGTTRTVTTGRQTFEECFFTWSDGSEMSFRFDRATLPLKAFGEHYACEPRGDGACELVWSYAYEWGGPLPQIAGRLFGIGFALNGKRGLKKLAKLLETEGDRWT
jgi:hypothetical protein